MTETTEKRLDLVIEALLFTSDKPLSAQDIRACMPVETLADIKKALDELKGRYDELERSFVLKEVAQGFQFRTRSVYAPYILQMLKTSPTRLSKAALETLSIIAYKQPILRQEVERLRGVDVGGIIRTLLEKGLVKIMGRKNLPGRPLIYGTTKKFLEVFDLKSIESLPKLKEVKEFGIEAEGTEMPLNEVLPDETENDQEKPGRSEDQKTPEDSQGRSGRAETTGRETPEESG